MADFSIGSGGWSKRQITRSTDGDDRLGHPLMETHREEHYGGVPWANRLAKRGDGVLVHDGFASRRVRVGDVSESVRGDVPVPADDADRVVKLVGSGHVHVLRHLLSETPMFCPVSPLEVLADQE